VAEYARSTLLPWFYGMHLLQTPGHPRCASVARARRPFRSAVSIAIGGIVSIHRPTAVCVSSEEGSVVDAATRDTAL
jgi:hypothetical protein